MATTEVRDFGESRSSYSMETVFVGEAHSTKFDITMLYEEQRRSLVRLATLLVGDLGGAEDLVQDAFVALYRRREKVRDPHAALSYLRVSIVNGSRSVMRRKRTARKFAHTNDLGVGESADVWALLADEHRTVLHAVQQLPVRQQQVLVLRYWSQLNEAEIASALGISTGTVKSTASRAIDKLENLLGGTQ